MKFTFKFPMNEEFHYKHNNEHENSNSTDLIHHKDVLMPAALKARAESWIRPLAYKTPRVSSHMKSLRSDGDSRSFDVSEVLSKMMKAVDHRKVDIFEVGCSDDGAVARIKKVCFRFQLNDTDDACVVISKEFSRDYFLKTCWLNKHDDTHSVGLNRSRYHHRDDRKFA